MELVLKLQVFDEFMYIGSVVEVFKAANAPVNFELIRDFTYEDLKQRDALQKNKCILLGVMVP